MAEPVQGSPGLSGNLIRVVEQGALLHLHQMLRSHLNDIAPNLSDPLRAVLPSLDIPAVQSLSQAVRSNEQALSIPLLPQFMPNTAFHPRTPTPANGFPLLTAPSFSGVSISPSITDRDDEGKA